MVLIIGNFGGWMPMNDWKETLGVDVDTLLAACYFGFYYFDKRTKRITFALVEHFVPHLKQIHTKGVLTRTELRFKLCDFKITWALTKEQLEKEDRERKRVFGEDWWSIYKEGSV